MYIPSKFRQRNIEDLVAAIQQYSFATLASYGNGEIEATHLPLLLEQVAEKRGISQRQTLFGETSKVVRMCWSFSMGQTVISHQTIIQLKPSTDEPCLLGIMLWCMLKAPSHSSK